MSSVAIVYRKDKLNKNSEAPVHFRIIKDRKISYIASGLMLPLNSWDFDKNKIKSKHTNSARLNSFLTNKFAEIQDQVFEHETVSKSVTSRGLRNEVFGKKPINFFEFAEKANNSFLIKNKIGTYDKNKAIIAKIKLFIKGAGLSFQDITNEFLIRFQKFLQEELGNKTNTANNSLKFISQMFKKAYAEDLIDLSLNPFSKFKIKEEKTQRFYLTEDELALIENYQPTKGTKVELHKDMFVFAAYTGGVRVSDMLQLKWKDFDGTNLNITMRKTGGQISVKVPNKAMEILTKYQNKDNTKNSFIFAELDASINLNDARELDSALSSATAHINKNLKTIASKAGVEKKLSFHISRHTWATRALRKGISIDKVSKLMGHSNLKDTQIYAKIVNSELDKAMDIFND